MEAADPSVSVDLLLKTLLSMGASRSELAGSSASAPDAQPNVWPLSCGRHEAYHGRPTPGNPGRLRGSIALSCSAVSFSGLLGSVPRDLGVLDSQASAVSSDEVAGSRRGWAYRISSRRMSRMTGENRPDGVDGVVTR